MSDFGITPSPEGVRFKIKVIPKSSVNKIIGPEEGMLKVKVTPPPADGAANEAVIKLLAKSLGISKSSVVIVSGHRSRIKEIQIRGISEGELEEKLGR
ncbi:MAG: DUF167 domain-containing protein [bacterium]|nr:DUF167 domain-containing protein [bacterium]